MDDLVYNLDIKLKKSRNTFYGCCPIHLGDNPRAFNIYHHGKLPGYWQCYTGKYCTNIFKKTILGFIRGVLSSQKFSWSSPEDRIVSFHEVIEWVSKFLKIDINNLKSNEGADDKISFINQINRITNDTIDNKKLNITKEFLEKKLTIPSEYFINRGFSKEILEKYSVGLCTEKNKPMSNRTVFPIYENNLVVSCTGRSIHSKCEKCNHHHCVTVNCPKSYIDIVKCAKWRDLDNVKFYLYNFWNAKEYILKTGTCVIVEGPPDCLKLVEAGINNAVAIFGSTITEKQILTLESSGAMKLIVIGDNDDAGQKMCEDFRNRFSNSYQLVFPKISKHDVGEMTIEEIKREVVCYV